MRSLTSGTYIRFCPQFQTTLQTAVNEVMKLMFIGPCIIVIVAA